MIYLTLISLAIVQIVSCVSHGYTVEDCWALGYNKANLLCSACHQLEKFQLEDLKDHCLNCCSEDESENKEKKYAKAILEVCTCKFGAYPQIQAFIKGDKIKKFKNLRVNYVRGLDPILKLYNEKHELVETLAIERWNTDTVEEYLKLHLSNGQENDSEEDYLKTNMI